MNPSLQTAKSLLRALKEQIARHYTAAQWARKGVRISPDTILMLDERSELVMHPGVSLGRYTLVNVRMDRRDKDAPPAAPGRSGNKLWRSLSSTTSEQAAVRRSG